MTPSEKDDRDRLEQQAEKHATGRDGRAICPKCQSDDTKEYSDATYWLQVRVYYCRQCAYAFREGDEG